MKVFLGTFSTFFRATMADPLGIALSSVFVWIAIYVYSEFWKTIGAGLLNSPLSVDQAIWYCAIAQVLGFPFTRQVQAYENDIGGGDLIYRMLMPYSYLAYHAASFLGSRLPVILTAGPIAAVIAWLSSGQFVVTLSGVVALLITGGLALTISFLLVSSVAFLQFWLEDVRPLQFILSRLILILGGVLFPLSNVSGPIGEFAMLTPFRLVAFDPANLAVEFDQSLFVKVIIAQTVILILTLGLATLLLYRGARKLAVGGA